MVVDLGPSRMVDNLPSIYYKPDRKKKFIERMWCRGVPAVIVFCAGVFAFP